MPTNKHSHEEFLITMIMFLILITAVAVMFSGCKSQEPAAPIVQEACKPKAWCGAYDKVVMDNIPDLAGVDWKMLCKSSPSEPKKIFGRIIKSISYAESGWDETETYKENFIDSVTKKPAMSLGMMQLSISDKKYYQRYKPCADLTEQSILKAEPNLACGTAMAGHLVTTKQTKTLNNLGLYWAVARESNKRFAVFKKKFMEEGGCE